MSPIFFSLWKAQFLTEVAVSAVFLHERPQRGLYLVTDLIEFVHVVKGHEVVS
jgi:hypothetical protein